MKKYRSINQHNSDFSSKLVSDLLLSFFSAQNGCIHNVTRKLRHNEYEKVRRLIKYLFSVENITHVYKCL